MHNEMIVNNFSELRKRVRYFLRTNNYSRSDIVEVINRIQPLGEVAIFGGMLRDLSLYGNKSFTSDVDLVVTTENDLELGNKLAKFNPVRNTYGGHRVTLNKWKVDIWPLSFTWAFKQGWVMGDSFSDLTKTTFFNWDAIVYSVSSGKVYCIDSYLDNLKTGLIDINLKPNPNPLGNAIRALRFIAAREACFSPSLTHFVAGQLLNKEANEICKLERKSHDRPILTSSIVSIFKDKLGSYQRNGESNPFRLVSPQLRLL